MLSLCIFELRTLLRAPAAWMVVLACLGLGFMVSMDELGPGMQALAVAATYRGQFFIGLASLMLPIALIVAIPLSFRRDATYRFEPIVLSAPWAKRVGPKWLAVFTFLLITQTALPLGMALGLLITQEGPSSWVTWLFSSIVPAWFWFGMLNAAIIMPIMVWLSLRWRHQAATYTLGLGLLLLFWSGQVLTGMPVVGITPIIEIGRWQLASLIDPFGLSAFFQMTTYWTVPMKNGATFPIGLGLLGNRVVWLLVATICFWRSLCLARHPSRPDRIGTPVKPAVAVQPVESGMVMMPQTARPVAQLWRMLRFEGRSLVCSGPWLATMLMWSALCVMGILMVRGTFSSGVSPRVASTSLILSYSAEPLPTFGLMIAVVFAAIILWRERQTGTDRSLFALPVSNLQLFVSKYLVFNSLFVAMIGLMIAIGWCYQLSVGYQAIDYGHWCSAFYIFGFPLLLQGSLVFVVQVLVFARGGHMLTAMAAGTAVVGALKMIPRQLDWHHPLLNPFSLPNLLRRHSELRGYGVWGDVFDHLAALWGLAMIPLLLLAWRVWPRPSAGVKPLRWGLILSGIAWLVVALSTGTEYRRQVPLGESRIIQAKADYERQFSHLSGQPVPQIIHSNNHLDLFPAERRLKVRARNRVTNTTGEAIESLLISARQPLTKLHFGIPFQTHAEHFDVHAIQVAFHRPWLPQETIDFSYETTVASTIFAINEAVDQENSYFLQSHFEPILGYFEGLEIRDPHIRTALNLPEKEVQAEDRHTLRGRFIQTKRTFDTTFSTSEDQIPLTSGEQVSSWVREGRRTSHFQSRTPIYPILGYFSGHYEVSRHEIGAVPVRVWSHPGHQGNVSEMVAVIRTAMDYCTRHFGPYPYAALEVIEIPATFRTGGRASAGIVALNEAGAFMLDPNPGTSVHTLVRRTVHEVVHQWFGEKWVPKLGPGEKVINESITKYVEAMIVARVLGPNMVRTINLASGHRYFAGRSRDSQEAPLVSASAYYLCYGKGALVFQALAEAWGEEELNRWLRSFLESHGAGMTATMSDLVARLADTIEEPYISLVEDGFLRRVTHDLTLENVVIEPDTTAPDERLLDLEIRARSEDRDTLGEVSEHQASVPVRVGLFPNHPSTDMSGGAWRTIWLQPGQHRYRIRVDQRPNYVLLDPLARQLELNRRDNLFEVDWEP